MNFTNVQPKRELIQQIYTFTGRTVEHLPYTITRRYLKPAFELKYGEYHERKKKQEETDEWRKQRDEVIKCASNVYLYYK